MANPIICTISGLVVDPTFTPIQGATIQARMVRPYVDPTSGALVPNFAIETLTAADGTWSLSLTETTTASVGVTIAIFYVLDQNNAPATYEYNIIVPATTTALFSDLIAGQT